jgi:hypothetical protein
MAGGAGHHSLHDVEPTLLWNHFTHYALVDGDAQARVNGHPFQVEKQRWK